MQIEEIIQKRKEQFEKEQDRKHMINGFTGGMMNATGKSTNEMLKALGDHSKLLKELKPKADSSIKLDLSGIGLSVDSLDIPGITELISMMAGKLDETFKQNKDYLEKLAKKNEETAKSIDDMTKRLVNRLDEIVNAIENIEVKSPTVNVAAPIVRIPEIKIPKAEVSVKQEESKKSDKSKIIREVEIYKEGILDGYEETYDDGSKHKIEGISIGNIKHEYK
jgi:hypothetical protein